MDDGKYLKFHRYNHEAQKAVARSEMCYETLHELGTKIGDNERGCLIFVIGPDPEDHGQLENNEMPNAEEKLNVGVESLVNPTFVDIKTCVSSMLSECIHPLDEKAIREDQSVPFVSGDCDWEAVAETWLACDTSDIMALCVGPFVNLGFSVYCFQRAA